MVFSSNIFFSLGLLVYYKYANFKIGKAPSVIITFFITMIGSTIFRIDTKSTLSIFYDDKHIQDVKNCRP